MRQPRQSFSLPLVSTFILLCPFVTFFSTFNLSTQCISMYVLSHGPERVFSFASLCSYFLWLLLTHLRTRCICSAPIPLPRCHVFPRTNGTRFPGATQVIALERMNLPQFPHMTGCCHRRERGTVREASPNRRAVGSVTFNEVAEHVPEHVIDPALIFRTLYFFPGQLV